MSFTNSSTGGILNHWVWDFGDNSTNVTTPDSIHTYTGSGDYVVNFTVWNSCGNFSVVSHTISVIDEPCAAVVANYSSDVSFGTDPLTVVFNDTSTGGFINNWYWDFGDGSFATTRNSTKTFSIAGVYGVNLTSGNSCGNYSNVNRTILVSELCPDVVANFSSDVDSGVAPLTVVFNDTSLGGTITNWTWEFGDGSTVITQNATKTFDNAGTYKVNLTAWNSCNNYSVFNRTILVGSPVCPDVVANFSSDVSSGVAPLTVVFNDTSLGGTITNWTWEFGDDSSVSTQNATKTFSNAGTYVVNLTAWNSCHNHSVVNRTITVSERPLSAPTITGISPAFGVNDSFINITNLTGTNFVTGAIVNLTREGSGNISGTNVTILSPDQIRCTFPLIGASSGVWSVMVRNPDGQTGYLPNGFTINPAPCPDIQASFTSNVSNGTTPLAVLFTDTSRGGVINSRLWNFGDGSPNATTQSTTHTFNTTGNFSVTLSTENTCGNHGFVTNQIHVMETPAPVTYTINASAGIGGNITPSGLVSLLSGESQEFMIGNATGYYISDVYVDGMSVGLVRTYQFRNITENHRILASFGLYPDYYSIDATAGSGGSISPSGRVVIDSGGSQSYHITPDVGKEIADVLIDGVSAGALSAYTFSNVTTNHQISALFIRIPGEYAINSSSNEWTSTVPSGNKLYPENSNQSFIMQAKPGSTLTNVSVDSTEKGPIRNWTFTNLSEDHSLYSTGTPIPGQIQVFFNATPRWGAVPLDVTFQSWSFGDPTYYYWQFGDGATETSPNPTHRYNSSGVFSVSLQAANEMTRGGGTWNRYITVTDGAIPEPTPTPAPERITSMLQYSPSNGTAPLSVMFTDTSSGNPTSWYWDFGDGSTSREQNPVHHYLNRGTYSVMLLAENRDYSGSVTISQAITVW